MRLAFNRHVLVDGPVVDGLGAQRMRMVPAPAVTAGLHERVVILVVGLAVAACAGLAAAGGGLVATLSDQPLHVATLLGLTLALQMFSVQVYGRGSECWWCGDPQVEWTHAPEPRALPTRIHARAVLSTWPDGAVSGGWQPSSPPR